MSFFRRKFEERRNKKSASETASSARTPSNSSTSSLPQSPDSWGEENDIGGFSSGVFMKREPHHERPKTLVLSSSILKDGQDIPLDSLESPMRSSSRLSKPLHEVMRNKDALACLKAFMHRHNRAQLVQFWCDAESFNASTRSRRRTHSFQRASIKQRGGGGARNNNLDERRPSEGTGPVKGDASTLRLEPSSLSSTVEITKPGSEQFVSQPGPDSLVSSSEVTKDGSEHNISKQEHDLGGEITSCPNSRVSHTADSLKKNAETNTVPSYKDSSPEPSSDNGTNDISGSRLSIKPSDKSAEVGKDVKGRSEVVSGNDLSRDIIDSDSVVGLAQGVANSSFKMPNSSDEAKTPQPSVVRQNSCGQDDIALKLKRSIERDAVTIFSTYLAKDAPKPIGIGDDLRSEAISKICREDGEVDPHCFDACQHFALEKISKEYFQSFKDSEHHCRHQVNVLTSEKIYLPDILLNENALCYFMEYMEQEGGSDLMQMWLAADNFQRQLATSLADGQLATVEDRELANSMADGDLSTSIADGHDWEQAQNDAMVIYDRYFSLQATNPLGFEDDLRFEIEGNICREGGPLPDCFAKAKNVVLKILDKLYFPGYLQSQVYYRYLSDLVSTVQLADDMHSKPFTRGHRRTESDASSEHSVGSQSTGAESVVFRNTLLAVDTRRHTKAPPPPIVGDFSMTPDMFNPDHLWKRPSASELTLGSVNQLGQFVSKFEPDCSTEKKKASGFFKKRKEKEKEQEEVALRIAQMIISDVNTMTKTGESMSQSGGTGS